MRKLIRYPLRIIDNLDPPIIQFSPIRSGSTLIYNMVRLLLPNKRIYKRHKLEEIPSKSKKYVITYRNPIDCLASSMKRFNLEVNDKNIKYHLDQIKVNGLDDLISVFEMDEYLKLKYEQFYSNFDYAFDALEEYFELRFEAELREKIYIEYSTDKVISKTSSMKDFSEYDKKNFFHGNHVSSSKGKPNSYQEYFNINQLNYIEKDLREYSRILGYKV